MGQMETLMIAAVIFVGVTIGVSAFATNLLGAYGVEADLPYLQETQKASNLINNTVNETTETLTNIRITNLAELALATLTILQAGFDSFLLLFNFVNIASTLSAAGLGALHLQGSEWIIGVIAGVISAILLFAGIAFIRGGVRL